MITLTINGEPYIGWISATVYRSLDSFAHVFEVGGVDHWAEQDSPRPIRLGDECVVEQDDVRLLTGHIDEIFWEYGPQGATMRLSGRSKTGDLVDCDAIHKTGQWLNTKPLRIIEDICAPFGIEVLQDQALVDSVVVRRFDLADGESAFSAIEKLARLRAWLPTTTPEGQLLLTRVGLGTVRDLDASLTIRREVRLSAESRHSEYRVRSQTARWDSSVSPRQAALSKISVLDDQVTRYRPTVLWPEHGATVAELEAFAEWTRNTRIAEAERVVYEMPGTLASDGGIWEPGQLVAVRDDQIGIDETMVVASTRLRVSVEDESTELNLARPEAYSQQPIPQRDLIRKLRKR